MSQELYSSIVSKIATAVPMFAKSIVDAAMEKHGLTASTVSPVQMMRLIRDEIQPRLRKFVTGGGAVMSLGAGMVTTSGQGRVLWIDHMARLLLGLPDDAVGDHEAVLEVLEQAGILVPGRPVLSPMVIEFYHPPSARTLNVALAPRYDRDGLPSGCSAIIQDVTLRVALEEEVLLYQEDLARTSQELAQRNAQLEEASRHKTEFLSRMSHELRTPLHCIIGYTQLAMQRREEMDAEDLQQNLGITITCAYDLLGIINEVLDLSRIESGGMVLSAADVDLVEVATESVDATRALVGDKPVVVEVLAPPVPVVVRTDRRRIKQVLLNLLVNAVKFTEQGSVTLSVEVPDTDRVVMRVTDTGIGIEPAQIEKIFESFYQVDGSTTRLHGGIGLGLALVRHVVTLMGGRIEVESEPGRGTTFSVILPAGM